MIGSERTCLCLFATVLGLLLMKSSFLQAGSPFNQEQSVHFCKGFANNYYAITFKLCQDCCRCYMKGTEAAYVTGPKCFCKEKTISASQTAESTPESDPSCAALLLPEESASRSTKSQANAMKLRLMTDLNQ